MKKFFLIFAVILIFLSGCSKNEKDKTVLTVSTWGSITEISTTKALIKEFELQNSNIKVNLVHIPDNYFRKLHLLVASNLMPDVVFVNNLNANIYLEAEKFEPLNSYLKNSKTLNVDDFYPVALDALSNQSGIYAIPRDVSNMVVYYNKDFFRTEDISFPKADWTMKDFLQIAQKLTKDTNNDGEIDVFGFGFEKNSLYWLPFISTIDGGIFDKNGKVILGTDVSKSALQFYSDLRNFYNVAPKVDKQASLTTSQLFLNGKVAMHLCGRWCSLTYKKNADFEWDVVELPNSANSNIPVDASGWAISSSSKYKNEAWQFIEFMVSEKSLKKITLDGLILPAKKNVANSKLFLTAQPKNADAFLRRLNNSYPTPVYGKYSEILDLLDIEFEELFNGKASVDEVIDDELVEKIRELMYN